MADSPAVILGAICARGGSKGVPRKNLRELAGRPLIAHTIECAQTCRALTHVVVSTDDEMIAAAARRYGADVPFMRPAELARDDSSKWDVFRHLVTSWEPMTGQRVSVLVDLDTGVPLRTALDISNCLDRLAECEADVVVTAYEAERNPYFNMVELDSGGLAHLVRQANAPITARQMAPQVFSLSPAVYAIRREALFAFEHWSQARVRLQLIPRERAVDIDTPEDFRLVEYLYKQAAAGV